MLSLRSSEALVHVLFFRLARRLATPILGSNPTWIRQRQLARRITCSRDLLRRAALEEIAALAQHFRVCPSGRRNKPKLLLGDTSQLTNLVTGQRIDAIITSPPYGTRIDYAMAMAIEIACLASHRVFDVNRLRRSLIGTTLTSHMAVEVDRGWGKSCIEFLARVRSHRSKASAAYYSRYYENYFFGLMAALRSIDRIATQNLPAIFVLQGSYYKEVYLDLGTVVCEMLMKLGWRVNERIDRPVKVSFTLLNPASRYYPKAHAPVESVIRLRKLRKT